jgi:hypothetical protein
MFQGFPGKRSNPNREEEGDRWEQALVLARIASKCFAEALKA